MGNGQTAIDLIGGTPLVTLPTIGKGLSCELYVKLEYLNPGGSVKDRTALAMVDAAEREGRLVPGRSTIVEATSGNTGVGLAMVAARRGYRCVFAMCDKMSIDKVRLLRAFGASVVLCPTAVACDHPDSYYSTADRLVREIPDAFCPSQYSNPSNPEVHERTTGPEVLADTAGRLTHFVAGAGTGGTVTGVGRYLRSAKPDVQIVVADPAGSVYSGGGGRPYLVEGVGEDFWPSTYDPSVVDRILVVDDAESFAMARRLAREEGLLVGGSSGTAVVAALQVARECGPGDVVVALLPDSGRSYLSTFFDDDWMRRRGFLDAAGATVPADAATTATMRDGDLPCIDPKATAGDARRLMAEYGCSHLVVSVAEPPVSELEVLGVVSATVAAEALPSTPIRDLVLPRPPLVGACEAPSALQAALADGGVALVMERGRPVRLVAEPRATQ